MTVPVRLQLSRKKGFSLQSLSLATNGLAAVNVARPGKWGNPFKVGPTMTAERAVSFYRRGLLAAAEAWRNGRGSMFHPDQSGVWDAWEEAAPHLRAFELEITLPHLRGKNLACFCKPGDPCHGDVLLELANGIKALEGE